MAALKSKEQALQEEITNFNALRKGEEVASRLHYMLDRCALFGIIYTVLDIQKHTTMKSQLEAQELENKNVKDVSTLAEIFPI